MSHHFNKAAGFRKTSSRSMCSRSCAGSVSKKAEDEKAEDEKAEDEKDNSLSGTKLLFQTSPHATKSTNEVARIGAKRLSRSLYPLLVNNEPLPAQNEELQHEPNVIRKRPTRRTTPATRDSDDWHGGAIFYSLKKLAHDRAQSCRT
ncbi:hypothetical protein G6011_06807 [Alternaria panax]|uniref:Uncharacterized protein n=1 Tax=Alternaria panax TaxID=48097 RepID=A0AAD4FG69_9PLEO|nr:hypothetical protein G6011_06807 [Alternaria panax]